MSRAVPLRRLAGKVKRRTLRHRAEHLDRLELEAEHEDLARALARVGRPLDRHLADRVRVLLDALGHPVPEGGPAELATGIEAAMDGAGPAQVWLALSVLTGRLPVDRQVLEAQRRLRLEGPRRGLTPTIVRTASWLARDRYQPRRVEVLTGAVTVDVHHTSNTHLATGIQRVARETARRWERDHDIVLVGWTPDYSALRRLDGAAHRRAVGEAATSAAEPVPTGGPGTTLVPWGGTHVTLELATEEPRTERMLALGRHSGNRTGVIGFDCVPLTTAETVADGMGPAFAKMLAAVRHMGRVATISEAAAVEYCGWRDMLAGTGLAGPRIEPVVLPVQAQPAPAGAMDEVRTRFAVGNLPLLLVVGSHEPRKNHLAVLHAAELLWRQGKEFSLLFVGGNAWKSERFNDRLRTLRDHGRPIETVSGLSDDMLWAAYRVAHAVLFPSLNEGFGLPVAEALACGTPVVTARYGSMAEIARGGGVLLVDPRDDHDIARAIGRLLDEPALHADLVRQAGQRPTRTWDDYAAEVWSCLVEGGGGA